jgi:hypothetical protein
MEAAIRFRWPREWEENEDSRAIYVFGYPAARLSEKPETTLEETIDSDQICWPDWTIIRRKLSCIPQIGVPEATRVFSSI